MRVGASASASRVRYAGRMSIRCLALLALLALTPALATNTEEKVRLRVTLYTGEVLEGTVKFKSSYLEVRAPSKKKIKYPAIESLGEIGRPSEEDLEKRRRTYARKAEKAVEPKDWVRVGVWAAERELPEEAKQAFEKALELDPDFEDAHHRLGRIKHEGEWVDAATVLATERRALKTVDMNALLKLARRAEDHGAPDVARDFLCEAAVMDPFDKTMIKMLRKHTEGYKQSSQPWQFPLRGRWEASPDRTRHHQLKAYAIYALDLMMVDSKGKRCRTDGKTNEDYYCFGAPVYAVAPGTVIQVREGFPDNEIGQIPDDALKKHNGIAIVHEDGEMSWYLHTKLGSITVKEGDQVEAGQQIAEVGNTGNSGLPHLHFTLARWGQTSLPWTCDDFSVIAPDGTPLRVTRGFPREGWIIEHEPEEGSK